MCQSTRQPALGSLCATKWINFLDFFERPFWWSAPLHFTGNAANQQKGNDLSSLLHFPFTFIPTNLPTIKQYIVHIYISMLDMHTAHFSKLQKSSEADILPKLLLVSSSIQSLLSSHSVHGSLHLKVFITLHFLFFGWGFVALSHLHYLVHFGR